MLLRHVNYLDKDFYLVQGDIDIQDGRIQRVGKDLPKKKGEVTVDCGEGCTIVPGFVDIHVHGCGGADTCDGTREALETMARCLLRHGVTSFCPTTMTVSLEKIQQALLTAKDVMENPVEGGARVVGVNMEGPFIAKERKGAQREDAIVPPDFSLFQQLFQMSGGIVRLVDVAPEQPGGLEFVQQASQLCTVSIAHTMADYERAKIAFDRGATHITHLFNAMSGLHHRNPGVVGAVLEDSRVRAEMICDGFHIHPVVLRIAFQALGDRAIIISDSMRGASMPEGDTFELGGQKVIVQGGKATLEDGTIAGSVTNLHQEVKNLVAFGIPFEQAVKAATLTPARAIGLEQEIGSIAPGKRADLVVLNRNLEITAVYH